MAGKEINWSGEESDEEQDALNEDDPLYKEQKNLKKCTNKSRWSKQEDEVCFSYEE